MPFMRSPHPSLYVANAAKSMYWDIVLTAIAATVSVLLRSYVQALRAQPPKNAIWRHVGKSKGSQKCPGGFTGKMAKSALLI